MSQSSIRLIVLLSILMIVAQGCTLTDALNNAEPPTIPDRQVATQVAKQTSGDPYLLVTPELYCPGEMVRVKWSIGSQNVGCLVDDSQSTCLYANFYSDPLRVPRDNIRSIDGQETLLLPAPSTLFPRHRFNYSWSTRDNTSGTSTGATDRFAAPITADTQRAEISMGYELRCDQETSTWQWVNWRGFVYTTDTGYPFPDSSCLGITNTCLTNAPGGELQPVNLTVDGVTRTFEPPWTACSESTFMNGYHPRDVDAASLGAPEQQAVIGQPCSSGDPLPIDMDGNPDHESFSVMFGLGCMDLSQLHGSAYEYCEDSWGAASELPPSSGGGGDNEPTATAQATAPVVECGPGWLPASGCSCCGTTLTCADGTIAEFNPTCMGGGAPDVCGDGICSPAEGAVCGTCSDDCGPC